MKLDLGTMFDIYFALGDSMSIDFYPAGDAESAGISTREDIGASALFHRNESALFPEFEGQDLSSLFAKIRYKNLAVDGATSEDLLNRMRASEIVTSVDTKALVTLTLGGNDLLGTYRRFAEEDKARLALQFAQVQKRYDEVVGMIKKKLPNCLLILTTVFDPTDGTGIMPSPMQMYDRKLPIEFLTQFNDHVLSFSKKESILVADVHKHFLGHGAECVSAAEFWYWKPSPIEPSYRGASEIRRVWLETVKTIM